MASKYYFIHRFEKGLVALDSDQFGKAMFSLCKPWKHKTCGLCRFKAKLMFRPLTNRANRSVRLCVRCVLELEKEFQQMLEKARN